MDGRMNPFSYLVEDVEREFFQKAAEEIAVDLRNESVIQEPEIPSRFQKLASLVYQSNKHGLTKQASEEMFSIETFSSYENILNKVAASAYWEPLGMTKSAMGFLTVLEEAGVDEGELVKFAEHILEDTIGTDALIEASMEKEAGDTRPIEEVYDELVKEALPAAVGSAARAAGSGLKWLGRNLFPGVSKNTISRAGSAIGRTVVKPEKFRRVGEALQKVAPSVRGKVRGFVDKRRLSAIEQHSPYSRRLHRQRKALRSQLSTAGSSRAVELGEKLKAVNRNLENIKAKMLNIRGKRRAAAGRSGVEQKTMPPSPKKPPKPSTEGAEKAQQAATPPPKTEAPSGGGLKPGEIEADAKRLHARGSRYGEEKQNRYGAKYVGPEDTPKATAGVTPKSTGKEGPGYREKKAPDTKPKGGAPDKAPGPRPPQEAVEGKGMGVMDAWTKWGKDGWGALSDVEKSRLIRAGVMAGGGAAAYKTVFGD